MAILKSKEIAKMNQKEINTKLRELRIELIKSRIGERKSGKASVREIKRTIAKLFTFQNKLKQSEKDKKNTNNKEAKKQGAKK